MYIDSNHFGEITEDWINSFWTTNEKETEKKRLGNLAGALQQLQELTGPEKQVSAIVYDPLHFNRTDGSSILVLWPTCKITSVFPAILPRIFCLLTKGASRDNGASPQAPSPSVGRGSIQVLLAYLKGCCSTFLGTSPEPISAPNKGGRQHQQDVTTCTWPPNPESHSNWVGQCSRSLRHPHNSYRLAKSTWHTQPIHRTLPT